MQDHITISDVLKRVHTLEADHGPDGWPAIQMRDLIVLRGAVMELRAELRTQRAGVRDVVAAAVKLVCAPAWSGISDEDIELEQALRSAGFVKPKE
jgi:hypothetical protein